MAELTKHAFRVPKGNKRNDPYREADSLCNTCKVMSYGMCPTLIALHDSGEIDPIIKQCSWRDLWDKAYEMMQAEAVNSANGMIRKQKKESIEKATKV